MSYRAFLTDLRSFFATQRDDPSRLAVLAIVVGTALVPLVAQLSLTSVVVVGTNSGPTLSYAVGDQTVDVAVSLITGSVVSFASALVYWLVATVGAYLLTATISEAGDLRTTFWILGWGFGPVLLSGVVWLIAMVVSIQMTPTPETAAGSAEFVREVQKTELVRATQYLDGVAIVLAGGLWTVGIQVLRRVQWWQAALAAVPGVIVQILPYLLL